MGKAHDAPSPRLVERSTRYVMLFALPNGHSAEAVRKAHGQEDRHFPPSCGGRSPGTRARRWPSTPASPSTPACRSTSAIPAPGSAARTRTPTACFASTLPKGTDLSAVTQAELDAVARAQRPPSTNTRLDVTI